MFPSPQCDLWSEINHPPCDVFFVVVRNDSMCGRRGGGQLCSSSLQLELVTVILPGQHDEAIGNE